MRYSAIRHWIACYLPLRYHFGKQMSFWISKVVKNFITMLFLAMKSMLIYRSCDLSSLHKWQRHALNWVSWCGTSEPNFAVQSWSYSYNQYITEVPRHKSRQKLKWNNVATIHSFTSFLFLYSDLNVLSC